MRTDKTREFDIANYLSSQKLITEYINQVLADGDTDELLEAIGHIARARSMTRVAKETGLQRESLYKSLKAGANPKFDTVVKVLNSFGVKLQAV